MRYYKLSFNRRKRGNTILFLFRLFNHLCGDDTSDSAGFDPKRMAELPVEAFTRFYGMGVAKAWSIISAMELAQRLAIREVSTVWMKALKA